MQISLPEDITKNLQHTKNFFDANIDTAVNAVNQNIQQAKTVILERTSQSIEGINQITESAKVNLTEASDKTLVKITEKTSQLINSITTTTTTLNESLQAAIEKINNLNQTLSEGIQASINSSLNSWVDKNPPLVWLINHPIQCFGILLLGVFLFSGLLGVISKVTEKFWLLILTSPFKLFSKGLRLISKSFRKDNKIQKTESKQRVLVILNRLEANRREQNLLLHELDSLLKPELITTIK